MQICHDNCKAVEQLALLSAPRVMSLLNRTHNTKNYGCFDRPFWHYKTIDFANSRMQEGSLTLALMYSRQFDGNFFYHNKKVVKLIKASIHFWESIMNSDGSFNESYPFEHHFCATALSTLGITQAIIEAGIENEVDHFSLIKVGQYLLNHSNPQVLNQVAGAGLALVNIGIITNEIKFKEGGLIKVEEVLKEQHTEGYFPEYGGLDVGYNTITLSFLADLYLKLKDERIKQSAQRCVERLRPHIDSNGYFSSEGMSRQTQYAYPYGFYHFAKDIYESIINGMNQNIILNPLWMDDRYFMPFLNDYLQTLEIK